MISHHTSRRCAPNASRTAISRVRRDTRKDNTPYTPMLPNASASAAIVPAIQDGALRDSHSRTAQAFKLICPEHRDGINVGRTTCGHIGGDRGGDRKHCTRTDQSDDIGSIHAVQVFAQP